MLEHARQLYISTRYADETWSADLREQVQPHVDEVLAQIRRVQESLGVGGK